MGQKKVSYLLFLCITIILFLILYLNVTDLLKMKLNLLAQILIGCFLTSIHVKNYMIQINEKMYWLFFSIASLLSLIGSVLWFFQSNLVYATTPSFNSALLWALSSLSYLIAIIHRLIMKNKLNFSFPISTNLVIYMVAASVMTYHYLVYPLYLLNENNMNYFLVLALFQLVDICLLFFILLLFYSDHSSHKDTSSYLLTFGMLLLISNDFVFALIRLNNHAELKYIADLVWTCSLLLIGLSSYLHKNDIRNSSNPKRKKRTWINQEFIFPYTTIVGLMMMYLQSIGWSLNYLGLGLLCCFLIVMLRQTHIFWSHKTLTKELNHNLYYDDVTKLQNKFALNQSVTKLTIEGKNFALLLITLERYKLYADAFGEILTHEIIRKIAGTITSQLDAEQEMLYKMNENEFALVMFTTDQEKVKDTSKKILDVLQKPIQIDDIQVNINANIGISLAPTHTNDFDTLQKYATEALYYSRKKGPFHFLVYNTDMQSHLLKKIKLESYLKNAIKYEELTIHYQPKVNLLDDTIIGMEALIRWKHPYLGWISPAEFIPLAEETGSINEIGEWVLKNACKDFKKITRLGYTSLKLSVNVSMIQFQNPLFPEVVKKVLKQSDMKPECLELEITESVVQNFNESTVILENLKKTGVQCSIDDFGTGYSSLNVLEQLPINTLKIDKSFIDRLEGSNLTNKLPMAKTIIDLGLNLNLEIVAEGIEYASQKEKLIQYGCTIGQGYLFSRPLAFNDFIAFLTKNDQVTLKS